MVSANLVSQEIRRFLGSHDAEVLCIRGRWGVGKTYLWHKLLDEALKTAAFAWPRYAYVSLFGVNSLEALKLATFENSEFVVKGPDSQGRTIVEMGAKLVREAQQYTKLLKAIPVIGNTVDGLSPLYFQSIRDEVICFDDLERRSKGLSVSEVLGLASFLREQLHCKIAFLFNDEALSASDKVEFDSYFEKVIDTSLVFAPSPLEASEIAIDGRGKSDQRLAENVVRLGISNIRVIRKIVRAVAQVQPMLRKYDRAVLMQAETTLALFGASVYQPDEAPPTTFISNWNVFSFDSKAELSDDQKRWSATLRALNFSSCDEFDLCLLEGLRSGVFDRKRIKTLAGALDVSIKRNAQHGSISAAWNRYRESFDDDGDALIDGLREAVRKNIESVSASQLEGVVSLVRKLRGDVEADELVTLYMRAHETEPRNFFDPDERRGFDPIADPTMVRLMNERYAALAPVYNIEEVLKEYSRVEILDEDRRAYLAARPVEEFAEIFRRTRGPLLRSFVNACLSSDRIINATAEERTISEKAKQALRAIGRENPLNAERIRTLYRINLDEPR